MKSVEIALNQINVAEAARQGEMAESTLRYNLNKLKQALPDILANKPPGPKAQPQTTARTKKVEQAQKVEPCPKCGGKVRKNGTYWVLNWVLMLTMGWLGVQKELRQRWRCKICGHELVTVARLCQNKARQAWWEQANRLIVLSRFKLRLSVRLTQTLVKFVYAKEVSVGHITRLTQKTGKQSQQALSKLKRCRQAVAQFLLYDETFPKMKKRCYSLGVAICEYGLIRSIRCIVQKGKDIPAQLQEVVGEHFQPTYFLTDLDVFYHKYMQDAGLNLSHLRDKVHLIRQIVRLFEQAIRDVTLDVPRGLPHLERKKQLKLKRHLLLKRLQPLLSLVFKAFSPGYEGVCVLMLEGIIYQLQDPAVIIQTASIQTLRLRLQRFVNKHGDNINSLLQLSVEQGTPTTTNSLESKNSILKPFSRIAKFFPKPTSCQHFFSGVALMENFDIKTRGLNKHTNAMQRAHINLDDFGATDFFSAVGLHKPQISLADITY